MEWSSSGLEPAIAFTLNLCPGAAGRLGEATLFIAAWMLGHHLVRVTGWSKRRRLLVGCSLAAAVVVLLEFDRLPTASEFDAGLPLSSVALPPAFVLGGGDSVDELLGRTAGLQAEVDALRAGQ